MTSSGGTGTGGSNDPSTGGQNGTETGGSSNGPGASTTEVIDNPDDGTVLRFLGVGETPLRCCGLSNELPTDPSACVKRGSDAFLGWTWEATVFADGFSYYPSATAEIQGDSCVEVQDYETETFLIGRGESLPFSFPISVPPDCADETVEILITPSVGLCGDDCPEFDQTLLRLCIE